MKISKALYLTLILGVFSHMAIAQTTPPSSGQPQPSTPVAPANASTVIATFNGGQITDEEVTEKAKSALMKPLSQIYGIKMNTVQNLVAEAILNQEAKSLKITKEALMQKNANSKVKEPTEAEIKALYEAEKNNRMIQGKKYEEVKDILVKLHKTEQQDRYAQAYIETLFAKYNVTIDLERPKADVSVDNDPGIGNPNAPIVLIEFSDFQCPYCKKTRPTIDRLLTEYKDKIYYVFRDFPLSFHKQAQDAALAANCAGEQKKYWEYNRELWNQQGAFKDGGAVFKSIAQTVGLNDAQFQKCMDAKKYDEIQKDQADGSQVGVSGTPAYFINGIFLSGAQPYESFKEIIDDELKRTTKK